MLTVLRHSQRDYWTSECKLATGRSAIKHLISLTAPKAVLMPCYVPEGIILPFQRVNIPIKFYKLRADLRPDLDHLSKMICKGALVIIIHYFGYLTETGAIREIVSNAGGTLFEDCAHTLFTNARDADVALWSLNKFLPVADGAILRSRRRDIDVTWYDDVEMPKRVLGTYHQHLELNGRLARCEPGQALDVEKESILAYEGYYKEILDAPIYAQSTESKCIVNSIDMNLIKAARSHNAASYYKVTPECFLFRPKPPIAPFAYPIVVRPPHNTEDVFNRLLNIGVLASRLIDKWDHIPRADDRFMIEHTFMDQHLLLPVGEEVSYNDVRRVGACLKELSNGD